MLDQPSEKRRPGLSVSAKISIGFSVVLVLHVSIAILGYFGLEKAQRDLAKYNDSHHQVETFHEIDRNVGSLQRNVLLFAFTGFRGPEVRATELQDELGRLLKKAEASSLRDKEKIAIAEMQNLLKSHREIFAAVVIDRGKRRTLVNDVLLQYAKDFDKGLNELGQGDKTQGDIAAVEAAFQNAQLDTMNFIHAPDSTNVRNAKLHLATAKRLLEKMELPVDGYRRQVFSSMLDSLNQYEGALIQMVQATRGYLHLVNVVLAGESEEFRRLAGDIRTVGSRDIRLLANNMKHDGLKFQYSSTLFSVITIVLGCLAAWLIGRDVAPPLNALASTFDKLAEGEIGAKIPAIHRSDELGRLAMAAHVFKERAAETERLLEVAKNSEHELNSLNVEMEKQTQLAKAMAEEATAATLAKSEFLANMSHEIRTPMTAILGFAETITEKAETKESIDASVTIRRNGEHLLAIINDILDLSKVEAGKMSVEKIDLDPCQVIAEVASLVKIKAEGAGISFTAEFEGPIPKSIRTDPTRLRQVLINLIGNAIKFTEIGSVQVITRCLTDIPQPCMQFDIVDSGIGMSQEQALGLFQPFSQADNSTTRKFGGTGLGLTISKRFAAMLGGDLVLVESEANVGSRFRFTVETGSLEGVETIIDPKIEIVDVQKQVNQGKKESLKGCHILLAEDGPDNQRLLTFVLNKVGAEVQVVGNGKLAVETALAALDSENPFDVILMDMQMPVMGGYEATQLLRQKGWDGPILALTANAMNGDETKCLEAGCDEYLTKPIDRTALVRSIYSWTHPESTSVSEEASPV